MRPVRPLLLLLAGAGALLLGSLPAGAAPTVPAQTGPSAAAGTAGTALELLGTAARAARSRSWTGTQYLASWQAGVGSSTVVWVSHDPLTGTVVRPDAADDVAGASAQAPVVVPSGALDEQLLARLGTTFALSVAGTGTCSGRSAWIVEARRADGRVAGRFWIDRASGLPLRREVWDPEGQQVSSSSYVDLQLVPQQRSVVSRTSAAVPPAPPAPPASDPDVDLPARLPGGFALYRVASPVHAGRTVAQAVYTDGLSSLAVFSQPGHLGSSPPGGYSLVRVDGTDVWRDGRSPGRVVWAGNGQVHTLVSDAGWDSVVAAVGALPHDRAPERGLRARFERGLSRIGAWFGG